MNSEKIFIVSEQIALKGDEEKIKKALDIVRGFIDGKKPYEQALKELEELNNI